MLKFGIIEDHRLMSNSIKMFLHKYFDGCKVSEYFKAADFLEEFNQNKFDLIILDLSLPNVSGFELLKKIKSINKNQCVIVYSAFTDVSTSQKCINFGCSSIINKSDDIEDFIICIYNVLKFKKHETKWITAAIHSPSKNIVEIQFTDHEIEFLHLICLDKSYSEIALIMNKSIKTIDFYRSRIFEKTQISSKSGLVKFATQYFFWQTQRFMQ